MMASVDALAPRADSEGTPSAEENGALDTSLPPLDLRVIKVVQACPSTNDEADGHTVRPARIASELGLSVEDATAELCGLLGAVGEKATFCFEEVGGGNNEGKGKAEEKVLTMTFHFPSDFVTLAMKRRRIDSAKSTVLSAVDFGVRLLKIVTAFGLIVSLAVLAVAGIAALIAALILLARGGDGGHGQGGHRRAELMRRVRSLFLTLRQLLWCYALFGPGMESGQDPFLREIAGDVSLALGLCCGNPGSMFFWWRMSMLNRRRRRYGRGWGGRYSTGAGGMGADSGIEGVALVRSGEWRRETDRTNRWGWSRHEDDPASRSALSGNQDDYRGLLSVAVEFLFGPEPFCPGPDDADRWKMRGQAVVALSVSSEIDEKGGGVTLSDLIPYVDNPPSSLDDTAGVNAEGLRIVAHFNGKPALSRSKSTEESRFLFPELMAEAESGDLFGPSSKQVGQDDAEGYNDSQENLLFIRNASPSLSSLAPAGGRTLASTDSSADDAGFLSTQPYLRERRHVLTKLDQSQFGRCCLLGFLNLIGIRWLGSSIRRGGLLFIRNAAIFKAADGLLAVLHSTQYYS